MNVLPSGWSRRALVELQAKEKWALNGGPFGSKLVQRDYIDSGIPVIRGVNLSGNAKFNDNDFVYVSERKADELRANNAQPGDVVFTQRGTIGQVGMIPKKSSFPRYVISQSQMKMTVDESQVLPDWIYYYFTAPLTVTELMNKAFSSGVPHINLGILRELQVPVPPLPTQRKIAAILSAYDDLIENNLRRIKILEEMAQNLYREWFVKFRFPGHQHARFTDSPLGRIPEGWEVKRLGDAFLIVLGGTPSRNRPEFWRNGTVPWINSGKVNDFRVTEPSELITELALKKSAAKLMPPGTTLIAITGATLGQVSILEIEASANQSVVGVISEDENLIEWLHLTIRERISSIINHASGGAQQHINKGIVDDVVVAVPPGNIAEKFRNIVHPLYRQIAGLIFKNITLRRTRDLLLPRLISGEVDVSELDIITPGEVAV